MRTAPGSRLNIGKYNIMRAWPVAVALLMLLVMGLAACGGESPPAAQPTEPPAPTAASETQPTSAPESVEAPATEPEAAETEATDEPAATATAIVADPSKPEPGPETGGEPDPTAAPEPSPTSEPESPPTEAAEAPTPVVEAAGGRGFTIGEGSEATFTVNEKLAWLDLPNDAVMRTTGLSGAIYLDGEPSVIELDLHSMTSDSDRRDGYVRNRMFPDDRTATFTVTTLGDLPDPLPEGEVISQEVQGELTIQGITKPITFDVEARRDPDKLFVLGRTTFTWQDLEIPPPNIPGRIEVKDEVQVEVLLSAIPSEP